MEKIIGFALLTLLISCDTGFEVNLDCVLKHTAEVVNVESSLLGAKDQVLVNLTWRWTFQKPEGDAVIVGRSIGDSLHFGTIDTIWTIDTVMFYNDVDTVLSPGSLVYYRLALLNGKAVDNFITTDVNIPSSQHFYQPSADTLSGDTLYMTFAKLQNFDDYAIGIYKAFSTEIESLVNLTIPLFADTITDTTIAVYIPDSVFPDTTVYTIKISSSKILEFITDSSIGFRAFFKRL